MVTFKVGIISGYLKVGIIVVTFKVGIISGYL